MKKIISIIKNHPFVFLLLGLVVVLAVRNYAPGTWLSGWDNLHPEFNFSLNIGRSLVAVWQEYQGLGLVGGMAHASELPRQIFLWICSLVLPASFLRYFYHFLMLLVGSLGVYFFIKRLEGKKIAFLGAAFYLLNFGTIQVFYTPFESFSHFWAFFPWEILVLLRLLDQPTRRNWFYLALVNFLAIPQAYVQTTFLVYLLLVGLILGIKVLGKVKQRTSLIPRVKFFSKIIGLILLINAFWLLPSIYFFLANNQIARTAKINEMATQEIFLRNKSRGTLADFALLKGYYLDYKDTDKTGSFPLMESWQKHLDRREVTVIGWVFFGLAIVGILSQLGRKKGWLVILIYLVSALALLSNTPGIAWFNEIIRQFTLVDQIFRSPFTKFIVPATFSMSVLVGLGIRQLANLAKKLNVFGENQLIRKLSRGLVLLIVTIAIIFYSWPIFTGNFFYPKLRIQIPQKYFRLFDFFKNQNPNTRIANLPQTTYWGWTNYKWGLGGSGFLWYGIKQPILDRAFDVWSAADEEYYWELNYAFTVDQPDLLAKVLEKYQINWVIVDEDILLINRPKPIDYQQFHQFLKATQKVTLAAQFDNLYVYQVNLENSEQNFVSLASEVTSVGSQFSHSWKDQAYLDNGDYYLDSQNPELTYLFPSLFTNKNQEDKEFSLKEDEQNFILTLDNLFKSGQIYLPSILEADSLVGVTISSQKEAQGTRLFFEYQVPQVIIDGRQINPNPKDELLIKINRPFYLSVNNFDYFKVEPDKIKKTIGESYFYTKIPNLLTWYEVTPQLKQVLKPSDFSKASNCGPADNQSMVESVLTTDQLQLKAKKAANCVSAKVEFPAYKNGLFKTTITYQSQTDEQPLYCLQDTRWQICLNKKEARKQRASTEPKTDEDFSQVWEIGKDNLYFSLILEANNSEQEKKISYSQIVIEAYPIIKQEALDLRLKKALFPGQVLSFQKEKSAEVRIAKNHSFLDFEYPLEKSFSQKESFATSSLYLPQNQAILVSISANHETNLPLKFWVNNPFRRRGEIDTFLSWDKGWSTNWLILPWVDRYYEGYSFHFENAAFGSQNSKNELGLVRVWPFPYEYLKRLKLVSNETKVKLASGVSEFQANKNNSSYYRVNLTQTTQEPEFLILSQAFSPGWQAYQANDKCQITNVKCYLGKYFPFVFGQRLEHVLVNNWENGWQIGEQKAIGDKQKVIIIFWPQYLEYLGFGLGLLGFGLVIRKKD